MGYLQLRGPAHAGCGILRFSLRGFVREFGPVYAAYRGLVAVGRRLRDHFRTWVVRSALGLVGDGVVVGRGVSIDLPRRVSIGQGCIIGPDTMLGSELETGSLTLGDNVHFVGRSSVDFTGGLTIGDGTFISEQAMIYTHDHGHDPRSDPVATRLEIGRNVWIGARSVIMPGVGRIDDDALIGLAAVVVRAVGAGEVVAGNPARVVGRRRVEERGAKFAARQEADEVDA